MTEQQLELEINHILESGTNEIRLKELILKIMKEEYKMGFADALSAKEKSINELCETKAYEKKYGEITDKERKNFQYSDYAVDKINAATYYGFTEGYSQCIEDINKTEI